MKKVLTFILIIGVISFLGVGNALALFIDFSDCTNYEVIDTKYAPELTLSSITNANNIITSMPTDTGTNVEATVFGSDSIGVSTDNFQGILLSFADLMDSVSIVGFDWGGDSIQDNETMYLSAFDQSGTYLGGNAFAGTYANPNTRYGTLTYDNIAHVAFSFGNTTLGFYGIDSIDATEMSNQPVPEPSTILLMGAGLLGLVGYNRKRFSKKS